MEITSLVYLAFVLLFCFIYYVIPKKFQWVILLVASLCFYVATSALLSLYMIATTAIVYLTARVIQRQKNIFNEKKITLEKTERKILKESIKRKNKKILAVTVIIVLSFLIFTKYSNFLGEIINKITGIFMSTDLLPHFSILLPLGISYYTLMEISYVVDVYRGAIDAEKNPLRVLLFVCYFPHIVEGPFDRYKDLNAQFRTEHKFDYDKIRQGILLVMFGFFKKLVIADRIGHFLPGVFENINYYSGVAVVMLTVLYTFQLYMDFSGCINIITGVSEIFDIKVIENFRQPFFSKSIDEFWRRWHISLGLWLKEYVFYPVSLSWHYKRVNKFAKKHIKNTNLLILIPTAYALFFVWFCNGLWHGASVKYIIYGLYYYILMILGKFAEPLFAKLCDKLKINRESKPFIIFQIFRTCIIVNIGMLIFRSSDLLEFSNLMVKMVSISSFNIYDIINVFPLKSDLIITFAGFLISLAVGIIKEKNIDIRYWLINHTFILRWAIYIFLIFSTLLTGIYGVEYGEAAAIYAQF